MRTVGCLSDGALPFATCDVFTSTRYSGNPLAIVEEADGLTTTQMQIIAREFNLSETIFVMRPAEAPHTARVRIFFPTAEIPFAGHPTIGCALHLALKTAPAGDFETEITLEEEAGLVPVRVWRTGGETGAELRAPVLPHAPEKGEIPSMDLIAQALGLAPEHMDAAHAPAVWQGGPAFLYVPVSGPEALAAARPLEPAWSQVMEAASVDNAYVYCPDGQGGYRARMFHPSAGIPEDPATGSASAILARQLLESGVLAEGESHIALQQGVEMGRPSQIGLRVQVAQGALRAVYVSGDMVPVSHGWITPPPAPEG